MPRRPQLLVGIGLLLSLFSLTSCVARHPAGIASSSAPVTLTYTVLGPTEETDCASWIFVIPIGVKDATHEIIDRLVKDKGADALIGVTVEERIWAFPLPIFGRDCTIVKGLAVKNAR
ncbi:MAG: hypothetical protein A4S17_01240 [Proteobacteria bacterium HN_bin10]|nr:MAG: hypothetical protein A4S17_01240 [Proteobacteria bacterium HN_bin10]